MKFKTLVSLLLVGAMVFSLAACGGSTPAEESASASGQETVVEEEYDAISIKLGTSDAAESVMCKELQAYSDYVKEQTGGKVTIEIYPSEQLGSNMEMAQMIKMASLDAMLMPQGEEANYAPKINVIGLPFLFENYDQTTAFLESDLANTMVNEDLANSDMIQLAYWDNGFRQVTNNVRPIEKPEDLKGLKIRTPEDAVKIAIFEAMGASASPLAFSELYLALQQGTFDGQENPLVNIYDFNFATVQKYLSITNHNYETKNIVFCKSIFESYPESVQNVLTEGAAIYAKEQRTASKEANDTLLDELKNQGMEVSTPDTSLFQEATASVYEDFYAQNDWAEEIVNQIEEIKASVK